MLNQLHCKPNTVKYQVQLYKWYKILKPLYDAYDPDSFRNRRNAACSKLDDVTILCLLCWQVCLKITVQTRYYQFLSQCVFSKNQLPERSRFNRICRNALKPLQWIREGLLRDNLPIPVYTIIDSIPMPLCLPVRNLSAKALKEYANIGYNATKKQHYYGLKGSFEVNEKGIVLAYELSAASVHDLNMVEPLLNKYSCHMVLADQGYISRELKEKLAKKNIYFWTPLRKNMEGYEKENSPYLKRKRRYIECVFSKLNNLFSIEEIRVRTLSGFISRLEQCLLVYTIQKLNFN